MQWKPIETAPLDGTLIRIMLDDMQDVVCWSPELEDWVIGFDSTPRGRQRLSWEPTHWAPHDDTDNDNP